MIKIFFILSLIFNCNGFSKTINSNILTPITNPKTGVTIHKRSISFIDIEAPIESVWVGCNTTDPKRPVSLFGAYLIDGDIVYHFIPRRAVYDVSMCLEEEKKYHAMMKGVKTVRLVGTGDTRIKPNPQPEPPYKNERAPRHIREKPKKVVVYFERLHVGDKCRSYFLDYCLPKNYWAGAMPAE